MSEVWPRDPQNPYAVRDVVMAGLQYRMTFIDQLAEPQVEVRLRSKSSPPVLPLWFRIAKKHSFCFFDDLESFYILRYWRFFECVTWFLDEAAKEEAETRRTCP